MSTFLTEIYISGTATFAETRFGIITRGNLPSAGFRVRINGFERRAELRTSSGVLITPEQYKCQSISSGFFVIYLTSCKKCAQLSLFIIFHAPSCKSI